MNRVVVSKVQSLQRCVLRAREEFSLAGDGFLQDFSRQDAAVLNIVRACELAIDLANHLISKRKLGIPSTNRDSFEILCEQGLIPKDLCASLYDMVGFRNVAVHTYQKLDLNIVIDVIQNRLNDVLQFADVVLDLSD